jgi:TRAP transporter TAXI family solute receptor
VTRPDSATRRRLLRAGAAGAIAAFAPMARADDAPIVLGTSTPGGGFSLYGETLARIVNARAGRELVRPRLTNGTVENLRLLREGGIDAALSQGTSASAILQHADESGLRILFAMYPSPGMLAVPASSSARRLEDLKGRPLVFGVKTSGLVTLGRQVYAGIGFDIDRDFDAIYVEQAAESPKIVLAGKADGLWGAGEGWPGFETLARSPGGARFLGPTREQIPAIVAKFPLLTSMEVAAGSYPGIDRPLPTVGSVNWILTRADLATDRATAFVRAMRDSTAELARALPQAAFSTLANTIASAPSRALLHPAVLAA